MNQRLYKAIQGHSEYDAKNITAPIESVATSSNRNLRDFVERSIDRTEQPDEEVMLWKQHTGSKLPAEEY